MKRLTYLLALCAGSLLAVTAFAGPEPIRNDYKSSKEIAQVAPPACDWRGFYIGVHGGYAWGNDVDVTDVDFYNANNRSEQTWSYDADGGTVGGFLGYNFQPLKWLVLGVEADGGWLGVDGSARQPASPGHDTFAETEDGFYSSWRGRVGFAWNRLMLYATGGGFGASLDHHVADDCNTGPCGPALGSGRNDDFQVGWTVGGGVEWMVNCHWSVRVEYLHYDLGDGDDVTLHTRDGSPFKFNFDDEEGHIVRAGLSFKF